MVRVSLPRGWCLKIQHRCWAPSRSHTLRHVGMSSTRGGTDRDLRAGRAAHLAAPGRALWPPTPCSLAPSNPTHEAAAQLTQPCAHRYLGHRLRDGVHPFYLGLLCSPSLSPFILLTFKCKNNKHLLSTCLTPVTLLCVSLYLFSKHSCNIYNMPETILDNFQILTQSNIQ